MIDQTAINELFISELVSLDARQKFTSNRKYSNFSIVSKIPKHAAVLDVGCGHNLFKEFFDNLIGIDPINDHADIKVTLQEYHSDRLFDAAICFGSLQFGSRQDVEDSIEKLCSMLKPNAKIFWRCWCDIPAKQWNVPFFYKWTFEDHQEFSKKFGFNLDFIDYDYNNKDNFLSYRIYAEWSR